MLVIERKTGLFKDDVFTNLGAYLAPDDLLVLNNTKVIPARVFSDDGRIEALLTEERSENEWICLIKPGKKVQLGTVISLIGVDAECVEIMPEGERVMRFKSRPDLDKSGVMPLPPYLQRAQKQKGPDQLATMDLERYQTVFASQRGAVAAPTAGLHFTSEILNRFSHTFLTLHVGIGTFRPVKTENLEDHVMHEERYSISVETAERINNATRVVTVGTTCVRALESAAKPASSGHKPYRVEATKGFERTSIFIHPPYQFKLVDTLLTNFHLPKSTLLMLVSAFAGKDLIMSAYAHAVKQRYRFFSYGDCMLIL